MVSTSIRQYHFQITGQVTTAYVLRVPSKKQQKWYYPLFFYNFSMFTGTLVSVSRWFQIASSPGTGVRSRSRSRSRSNCLDSDSGTFCLYLWYNLPLQRRNCMHFWKWSAQIWFLHSVGGYAHTYKYQPGAGRHDLQRRVQGAQTRPCPPKRPKMAQSRHQGRKSSWVELNELN